MRKTATSCMFIGEDSAIGESAYENPQSYFPETWQDWSPGLSARVEWAWKYYSWNADPYRRMTPKQFICHCGQYLVWRFIAKRNSYRIWPPKTRWPKIFWTIARNYEKYYDSCKQIKLVWS